MVMKVIMVLVVTAIVIFILIRIVNRISKMDEPRIRSKANPYEEGGAFMPDEQMRIVKESMELMERTSNPVTYFSRAKLAAEKARECIREPQIVWNGLTCKQIYDVLTIPEKRAYIEWSFINKLLGQGREDNLVFQMHEVGRCISRETLTGFVQKLKGKRYHFIKVRLDDSDRLYTYVTRDPAIKQGDLVTIPTGNALDRSTKLKQVVEAYDAPLDTLEFPLEKLRCVEDKINTPSVEKAVITMNLISLECPNCGATLQVNDQLENCTCNYCGHAFYISAKTTTSRSEGAATASKSPDSVKNIPREYINALHDAYEYSTDDHMSKQAIYEELTDAYYGDKFSPEAAKYAVENMNVDWFQNALEMAKSYYYDEDLNWSKNEIREELSDMEHGDKFTLEEAQYAIDHLDD